MFTEEDFRQAPITVTICGIAIAVELALTLVALSDPHSEEGVRLRYYNEFRLGIWVQIWLSDWCRFHLGDWWPPWMGEWWRPFTTTLLHGNILHAFFNVGATMVFGRPVESWLGPWRYLGLLVLLAYVSSLTQFCVWPVVGSLLFMDATPNTMVGFSGVGYGLFGFVWMCRNYRGEFMEVCHDRAVETMMGMFLLFFVLTALKLFPVANLAHAGGLGLGMALGLATVEKDEKKIGWIAVSVAGSLLALSTLLYCPWHPYWPFGR